MDPQAQAGVGYDQLPARHLRFYKTANVTLSVVQAKIKMVPIMVAKLKFCDAVKNNLPVDL